MKYIRMYADPSGETHFEDVEIELAQVDFGPSVPPVNLSSFSSALQYAFISFPAGYRSDWHTATRRVIHFVLSGETAVQVSDGEVQHFGAGSVLLEEDTTGKGHAAWVVSKTDVLVAVVHLPN